MTLWNVRFVSDSLLIKHSSQFLKFIYLYFID